MWNMRSGKCSIYSVRRGAEKKIEKTRKNFEKRLDKAGMECYNDEADPRERRESEAKAGKRLDLEN